MFIFTYIFAHFVAQVNSKFLYLCGGRSILLRVSEKVQWLHFPGGLVQVYIPKVGNVAQSAICK